MDRRVSSTAHFVTIGGFPKPFQDSYQSFASKHPTWTTILWTAKDVDRLLRKHKQIEYFNSLTSFIAKYNFAKYSILAEHGGWYVDLDITWKKSLDELIRDKMQFRRAKPWAVGTKQREPEVFIPVRILPRQEEVDEKMNDDCLLFSNPGHFFDLIEFSKQRALSPDIDLSIPYEPFGPRSISEWIHKRKDLERIYMYENEIQINGRYCDHANSKSWIFS